MIIVIVSSRTSQVELAEFILCSGYNGSDICQARGKVVASIYIQEMNCVFVWVCVCPMPSVWETDEELMVTAQNRKCSVIVLSCVGLSTECAGLGWHWPELRQTLQWDCVSEKEEKEKVVCGKGRGIEVSCGTPDSAESKEVSNT